MQHLLERHVLDVMHCEKNLCENIVKTLWGMNDSLGSRIDAHELGIREEIWLQESRRRQDEYYMLQAPYMFKPHERKEFVAIISNIRTPFNYVGSIHKRLMDGKLQYMKTHDYHVLMQQVRRFCVSSSSLKTRRRTFHVTCERLFGHRSHVACACTHVYINVSSNRVKGRSHLYVDRLE